MKFSSTHGSSSPILYSSQLYHLGVVILKFDIPKSGLAIASRTRLRSATHIRSLKRHLLLAGGIGWLTWGASILLGRTLTRDTLLLGVRELTVTFEGHDESRKTKLTGSRLSKNLLQQVSMSEK
jgi:hypothetical protein